MSVFSLETTRLGHTDIAATAASGRLGQVAPHFYSFGGVAATGRWAAATAAAAGRIVLDRTDGFRVEPP
jgi:hypothetical protein